MSAALPAEAPRRDEKSWDAAAVRALFPTLQQEIHGEPLVYLDSAASALRPRPVLDAIERFEATSYSNVHRGVHTLSQRATEGYEGAREIARRFVGAAEPEEIVFVRGTTEALNLVAQSWGRRNVGPGDAILVTPLEHHSNLVPWQLLAAERGARLLVLPIADDGDLELERLDELLAEGVKILAVTHVSNAIGTVTPLAEITARAHAAGALVAVDGAQSAPHMPVDVQELGCDFYAFSGHKVYGPSGIGVLYGRRELLDAMPPWQGGGSMILEVQQTRSTFAPSPMRFEAGTPNITGAVGLGAALEWVESLGRERAASHEALLLAHAERRFAELDGVRVMGAPRHRAGVLSFVVDGVHPHDVGMLLDGEGIAVRAGHHCAQPLMTRMGVAATTRLSLGLYNTRSDIDRCVEAVVKAQEFFA